MSPDGARALTRRRGEDIDRRLLPEPLGGLVGLLADPRTLVVVAVPICPDGTLAGLDDDCRRDLLSEFCDRGGNVRWRLLVRLVRKLDRASVWYLCAW